MSTSDGELWGAEAADASTTEADDLSTTEADLSDATDGSMTEQWMPDQSMPSSTPMPDATADGDLDWELAGPETGVEDGLAWAEADGAVDLGAEPVGSYEGWWPEPTDAGTRRPAHPVRLALGVAVLAAERLRAGSIGDAFATGVGLVESTATQARRIAGRISGPPRTAAGWVASLPGASKRLRRSRGMVDRALSDARRRGRASVAAGRAEAQAFLSGTVNDGLAWAQAHAVPQLVDSLVPHLVDEVVPRLIDGSLPDIRARVLPVLIDDLTSDPQVREMIVEQGRSAVRDAAHHLRSSSANADDRVESAYRKMLRSNGSE